jgi:hypothetical protein
MQVNKMINIIPHILNNSSTICYNKLLYNNPQNKTVCSKKSMDLEKTVSQKDKQSCLLPFVTILFWNFKLKTVSHYL